MVFPPGAYICFGDAMKRILPLLVLCLLLTGCVALPAKEELYDGEKICGTDL